LLDKSLFADSGNNFFTALAAASLRRAYQKAKAKHKKLETKAKLVQQSCSHSIKIRQSKSKFKFDLYNCTIKTKHGMP
jgi:hypothetical protein